MPSRDASTFFRPSFGIRPPPGKKTAPIDDLPGPTDFMKTSHIRAADLEERWYLYDASKFVLGRMASEIAVRLQGKDHPTYTPSELCGAHVVVTNATQVVLTGKKADVKAYPKYSGYPGGLYVHSLETLKERRPQDIVKLAVRRMLPKTRLGKQMLSRLKVYGGSDHPHSAQKPAPVEELSS